jgi:hypothetical protein
MKKVAAVFAIVVLSLGMLSCDADATAQDDNLFDAQACDTCEVKHTGRG